MKKKIFTVFILFVFTVGFGQFTWTPSTIYLNDGTVLKGEANFAVHEALKLMSLGNALSYNNPYVRYRKNKDEEEVKYISNDVEKVVMLLEGEEVEFVPIYTKRKKRSPYFMHKMVEGEVTLYIRIYESANMVNLYDTNGMLIHDTAKIIYPRWYSESTEFYVKRANEDEPTVLRRKTFKSFKKRLLKYFKGCPKVTKDIENRKYNRKNLSKLVEDYNACISN